MSYELSAANVNCCCQGKGGVIYVATVVCQGKGGAIREITAVCYGRPAEEPLAGGLFRTEL